MYPVNLLLNSGKESLQFKKLSYVHNRPEQIISQKMKSLLSYCIKRSYK